MPDTLCVVASIPAGDEALELLKAGAFPAGTRKDARGGLVVPLAPEPAIPGFDSIEYAAPKILASLGPTYRFNVQERGDANSYVCVVAGKMGQSLRPYHKSSTPEPPDWHGASHFTGYDIGIVSFSWGDGAYELGVKRWQLVKNGAIVCARPETLVSRHGDLVNGGTIPPNLILPNKHKIWTSALAALYRRLNCTGCGQAHYAN